MADDGEIVRDQDVREPETLLQVAEEVHDLRLGRHVERAHRFVEDEELGLEGERAGDGDALELTTGELAREPVEVLRGEADEMHQLLGPRRAARTRSGRGASRIGSRTLVRSDALGSNAECGSWNTIWISRRTSRSARPVVFVMSRPSKKIRPDVTSSRRSTSRPTVDLPDPDSPTSPTVVAGCDREVDAVDGVDRAADPPQQPLLDRELA